jgi:hypothetical protein
MTTASSPQPTPSRANSGSWPSPATSWAGTVNSGPSPMMAWWTPAAMLAATTSGRNARAENSKSSSSIASTTAASGAPNVAAMPAAAPEASRILRSDADTCRTWPSSEPRAPPVTMMGPSAPNGPPVPMATAADTGLATAVRGWMRLCFTSTASMASGRPWPRMTGAHLASRAMSSPPVTAATTIHGLGSSSVNDGGCHPHWWNSARLVMRPIRWSRTQAAPPPARPRAAAHAVSSGRRLEYRMAR